MTQYPPRTSSLPANRDQVHPNVSTSTTVVTSVAPGADIARTKQGVTKQTEQLPTVKSTPDFLSDKATAAFIRRTLCANHALTNTGGERGRATPRPIDELLPPLTSSNEVDLQLYAILAVILKEFVYSWYAKITPDHVFVEEVIRIIAHCTRALEQRLRKVDLEALVLDELPNLIELHVKSYRVAHEEVAYPSSLANSPREVYHVLVPHPALSPVPRESEPSTVLEQIRNEESWRQLLVHGVLAVLLPTEDLENGCLRALVAEIFSDMILGNGVSGKACEPWLLWDAITTVIEALQPKTLKAVEEPTVATSRLEQFGLLSLSKKPTAGHQGQDGNRSHLGSAASNSISGMFWAVMSFLFMASTAVRTLVYTVATSSSLPTRSKTWSSSQSPIHSEPVDTSSDSPPSYDQCAILDMSVWTMVARVFDLDIRLPWLFGLFSLSHQMALYGPGRVGDMNGALDR
ncbi:hypothetical protein, variant [Verruconis gallopava]|nr:hypothetical protein, variant [Verruconis gallopava]KIW06184.1 hypothetical protein, variant [Verruconis gallopava]